MVLNFIIEMGFSTKMTLRRSFLAKIALFSSGNALFPLGTGKNHSGVAINLPVPSQLPRELKRFPWGLNHFPRELTQTPRGLPQFPWELSQTPWELDRFPWELG